MYISKLVLKGLYFSWAKCLEDLGHPPPSSLDHSQFLDIPGQIYTAKKQCQILLRDVDAVPSPNQDVSGICQNLHCKTPHRSGYYFAGPALEGTKCGPKKVSIYFKQASLTFSLYTQFPFFIKKLKISHPFLH